MSGYTNIQLVVLTEETAMVVRNWRNSSRISQFMEFREEIPVEDQLAWFKSVKKSDDRYFTIHFNGEAVGLIHLNRMSVQKQEAYAGLFIGNKHFEGTGIAFPASIQLLDLAFEELPLRVVFAKVHKLNKRALDYNLALGFFKDGMESKDFIRLKLTKNQYVSKRKELIKLLSL